MPVSRFARLMLSGVAGPSGVFYETWISEQPALLFTAVGQYLPGVTMNLSKVLGPRRIEAFQSGKDVYKMSSWFRPERNEE